MIRNACRLLLAPALLLAVACQRPSAEGGAGATAAHDTPHAQPGHADAGHAAGAGAAHEALPLRPIMQQLSADMAGLSHALWVEDYEQMTARATAIADHAHISPEEVRRIQAALGPDMPAFEEADEAVHQAAVRLREAVGTRRTDAVVERLGEVQRGCVSCHTQFRGRLRTDRP